MLWMLRALLKNEKGDVNWTPIYILILAAIAAILLISVIKPLYQEAVYTAQATIPK